MLFIVSTVPVFFVGLLLIYVFAVKLELAAARLQLQLGATPTFSLSFIWDVLKHAILPGLSLVIVTAGLWVYSMRNNMITTISEDYVKMARAKGLPSPRIMFDYAARNAILPNLTGFAMQLGYVLGGAIVIEYLFSYPGLGYLFYTATTDHDLPLMQGLFLFYTLAVLVCVLIADLVTAVLDPTDAGGLRWRLPIPAQIAGAIPDVEATRCARGGSLPRGSRQPQGDGRGGDPAGDGVRGGVSGADRARRPSGGDLRARTRDRRRRTCWARRSWVRMSSPSSSGARA